MVHPVFSIAVYQRPTLRAFGIGLWPLTLGHIFLLREKGNLLLIPGSHAELGDVLFAAFVCAFQSHDQARKALLNEKELDRFLNRWGAKSRVLNLPHELQKFFEWWKANFAFPDVRSPVSDAKPVPETVPNEWITLAMLMADFGMNREQAYATELSFATALWAAQGHRTGKHIVEEYGMSSASEAAWRRQHEIDMQKKENKEGPWQQN